jgi:hypothetical protein
MSQYKGINEEVKRFVGNPLPENLVFSRRYHFDENFFLGKLEICQRAKRAAK